MAKLRNFYFLLGIHIGILKEGDEIELKERRPDRTARELRKVRTSVGRFGVART